MLLQALSVPENYFTWEVHFIIVVVNFRGLTHRHSPQFLLHLLNDLSDVDLFQPRCPFLLSDFYRDFVCEYAFRDSVYFRDVSSVCVLSLPSQRLSCQASHFDWRVYCGGDADFCGVCVCQSGGDGLYVDCCGGDDDCLPVLYLRHVDYLSCFGPLSIFQHHHSSMLIRILVPL